MPSRGLWIHGETRKEWIVYFRFHHEPEARHLRVEVLRALRSNEFDEAISEFRRFYSGVPEPESYVFCFACCTHSTVGFINEMLRLANRWQVRCCCLTGETRMTFDILRIFKKIPEIPHDESVSSKPES